MCRHINNGAANCQFCEYTHVIDVRYGWCWYYVHIITNQPVILDKNNISEIGCQHPKYIYYSFRKSY